MRWLAVAALCSLAGAAHADRADQLFKKGKKLLGEKRYAEACTAFEQSDRIDPEIGAKLNVARCYQEWGKLATALRWYTEAEKLATSSHDERAAKIHDLIQELDPQVPRLALVVPPNAILDKVVVRLDGVELSPTGLAGERRVDPGPHQVETIVDGDKQTRMVPLERGGSAEVTLEVPTRAVRGRRGGRRPDVGAAERSSPDRTREWVGLGVAGAGGAAIVIAGIITLRERSDYHNALSEHCSGATDMCDDIGLDRTHRARSRANIATGVTIAGLAAVGAGLYLYFTARDDAPSGEHALRVLPSIGPDGAGIAFGGAF